MIEVILKSGMKGEIYQMSGVYRMPIRNQSVVLVKLNSRLGSLWNNAISHGPHDRCTNEQIPRVIIAKAIQ